MLKKRQLAEALSVPVEFLRDELPSSELLTSITNNDLEICKKYHSLDEKGLQHFLQALTEEHMKEVSHERDDRRPN